MIFLLLTVDISSAEVLTSSARLFENCWGPGIFHRLIPTAQMSARYRLFLCACSLLSMIMLLWPKNGTGQHFGVWCQAAGGNLPWGDIKIRQSTAICGMDSDEARQDVVFIDKVIYILGGDAKWASEKAISRPKAHLKILLFPRWEMLVPWVSIFGLSTVTWFRGKDLELLLIPWILSQRSCLLIDNPGILQMFEAVW